MESPMTDPIFERTLEEIGPIPVLVMGLPEGVPLAIRCAEQGATVACFDPEAKRVVAAREEIDAFRASSEGASLKGKITTNQGGFEALQEKFRPATFQVALVSGLLSRTSAWREALRALYWAMHPDGSLAITIPHPCFTSDSASYFSESDEVGQLALSTWLRAAGDIGFSLIDLREAEGLDSAPPVLLLEFGKDKWAP